MKSAKEMLTAGVLKDLAPQRKTMNVQFDKLLRDIGMEKATGVRAVIAHIMGCMNFQGIQGPPPKIHPSPGIEWRAREGISFLGQKEMTGDVAGKIRASLLHISAGQRLRLYDQLIKNGYPALVKILDDALNSGKELSQAEMAEATRLRLLLFLSTPLQRVLDLLMAEWTFNKRGEYIDAEFPPQYSGPVTRAAAAAAKKYRVTGDDLLSLQYFLAALGAKPDAMLDIQAVLEELDVEDEKPVRKAPPEEKARSDGDGQMHPGAQTQAGIPVPAQLKKTERKELPAALKECVAETDRAFGFRQPLDHTETETYAESGELVADTEQPLYARARDALHVLWQPSNGHQSHLDTLIVQTERTFHAEFQAQQIDVDLYGKGGVKEAPDAMGKLVRYLCTIERQMRREFVRYVTQQGKSMGPGEERIYAALRRGLAASVVTFFDDAFRMDAKGKHDGPGARAACRIGASNALVSHHRTTESFQDPEGQSTHQLLQAMCDNAADVLPLLQAVGDDHEHIALPGDPVTHLAPSIPGFSVSRIVQRPENPPLRSAVRYVPDAAQSVDVEAENLHLAMETPGSMVCLPGSAVPLHSMLFPNSAAMKKANAHADTARAFLAHGSAILDSEGILGLTDALGQFGIRPHVVLIMNSAKGPAQEILLWESSAVDALQLRSAVRVPGDLLTCLQESGIPLPADPWMTTRTGLKQPEIRVVSKQEKSDAVRKFLNNLSVRAFPLEKAEALLRIAGIHIGKGTRHGKATDEMGRSRALGNRVFGEGEMPKDFLVDMILRTQRGHLDPIGNIDALYEWIQAGGRYEDV